MNNLQKLSLYFQLEKEIKETVHYKNYIVSTHGATLCDDDAYFSAWPRENEPEDTMSFLLKNGVAETLSIGQYNEAIAQEICDHLNDWLKKVE